MQPRPDPRVRNLGADVTELRVGAGRPGSGEGAGDREWDRVGPEVDLERLGHGAREAGMAGWVVGVGSRPRTRSTWDRAWSPDSRRYPRDRSRGTVARRRSSTWPRNRRSSRRPWRRARTPAAAPTHEH